MADYLVTDTELTDVADAIRTKGGTSTALEWPDDYVDAIDAIETGGGGGSLTTKSVTVTIMSGGDVQNVYYTNANGQVAESGSASTVTVNAAVGTVLVAQAPQPATAGVISVSGATVLYRQGSASNGRYATAICEVTA